MPICQYCKQEATHVKGDKIYPHRKDEVVIQVTANSGSVRNFNIKF